MAQSVPETKSGRQLGDRLPGETPCGGDVLGSEGDGGLPLRRVVVECRWIGALRRCNARKAGISSSR